MSQDSDLNIEFLCLKWRVDARNKSSDYTYSSEFGFKSAKCVLGFWFNGNEHSLCLDVREGSLQQFNAVVDVENGGGQILPELKSENQDFQELRVRQPATLPFGQTATLPFGQSATSLFGQPATSLFGHPTVGLPRQPSICKIWGKKKADIIRGYSEFCRNDHELRFRVLLKAKDAVLKDTDSVATQTECIFSVNSCLELLSGDLAQLMIQDSDPDVEFQCGDESTMAHRIIVCSRSPVLASMLSTDMVEGRTGVVRIPNMEPDVFRRLLKYLYTGTLEELTFSVALSLYEAGDQYGVRGLAKRCSGFLLEHLDADNACDLLLAADAHGDDAFKEAVVRFMVENKVPQVCSCWLEFCSGHLELAVEVLNRMCNVVTR